MASYAISTAGNPPQPRLISSERLDAARDFDAIAGELARFGGASFRARKISFVAAHRATEATIIETRYNGKELQNAAKPGDWIVTNMDANGALLRDKDSAVNTYVIVPETFAKLYDRHEGATAFGDIYKAKGVVDAIALPGGFDIVAPWGERQVGPSGYLLRNGADIYGIHADAFDKTYERLT